MDMPRLCPKLEGEDVKRVLFTLMSSSVLVLGGSGMLGTDLVPALRAAGFEVLAPTSADADISNPVHMAMLANGELGKFDWVVNCAAYTAVDVAETDEDNAHRINALGPGYLAIACAESGTKLIHISTDYVFDGKSTFPITESVKESPLGVYGRTKFDGENAIMRTLPSAIIFRTSWLFGAKGKSFPKTILKAFAAGKSLKVVNDQMGTPTSTLELSEMIVKAIDRNLVPGIYHAAGKEVMSWHRFASLLIALKFKQKDVVAACSSDEYPTLAPRPGYSALDSSKIYAALQHEPWPIALAIAEYLNQLDDNFEPIGVE
jgi:dTDP-4-dehydrorhamnose reductase